MGDQDGLSFCGGRNYKVVDWSSQFSAGTTLTINAETDTLVLESTSDADVGKFDVEVEISLKEYPQVKSRATISVVIDPCQVVSFDGSISEVPLSYSVNTDATAGGIYSF